MDRTYEQIMDAARERGYEAGRTAARNGERRTDPLSGEWAGESMPEIIGDLVDEAATIHGGDPDADCWDDMANEYETGYEDGQLSVWGDTLADSLAAD